MAYPIPTNVKMRKVESSNIKTVGYDAATKTLYIRFRKTNAAYAYIDVPESVYLKLFTVSSVGEYFADNIKDNYSHVKGPTE